MLPEPALFTRFTVPNARTVSMIEDPAPGRLIFWGVLDAVPDVNGGTA
jgi:hypothetical protein